MVLKIIWILKLLWLKNHFVNFMWFFN
jgi:hypothetical protein